MGNPETGNTTHGMVAIDANMPDPNVDNLGYGCWKLKF